MYVIIVYDINVERVSKVCAFFRRYLKRVQNSVFEGEITKVQFREIKNWINNTIVDDEDSIRIYIMHNDQYLTIEHIGREISESCQII